MDGLSGAASGMAVISLSLQLIQSIDSIKTFVRQVKGASAELRRLHELLERLGALLDDVRRVMELQTSCLGPNVPAPSTTILSCLNSCARQLEPVQMLVKKYDDLKSCTRSKATLLCGDIKLGLKAKDIAALETRIQHEITNLSAALLVNTTSIQLHGIVMSQQTKTEPNLHQAYSVATSSPKIILNNPQCIYDSCNQPRSISRHSRRTRQQSSSLQRFGLYYERVLHTHGSQTKSPTAQKTQPNSVLYEEVVYRWISNIFRFGIRCSYRRPHTGILPSLSIHPVISYWSMPMRELVRTASVQDLQQMFYDGTLHPFTRTQWGESLLHLAAFLHRADICRLLLEMGVKSELSFHNESPLARCSYVDGRPSEGFIDTFRLLFEDPGNLDDPEANESPSYVYEWSPRAIEGVYMIQAKSLINHVGLSKLEHNYLYNCFRLLREQRSCRWVHKFLRKCLTPDFLRRMDATAGDLFSLSRLFHSFFFYDTSIESYTVGQNFVAVLEDVGISVEEYLLKETEKYPDGLLESHWSGARRKIIVKYDQETGWIVGWEWEYDETALGFLVVSEYSAMTGDTYASPEGEWPFGLRSGSDWSDQSMLGPKWEKRRARRMASKARKELKRSGQKRPRSKMPGSWI